MSGREKKYLQMRFGFSLGFLPRGLAVPLPLRGESYKEDGRHGHSPCGPNQTLTPPWDGPLQHPAPASLILRCTVDSTFPLSVFISALDSFPSTSLEARQWDFCVQVPARAFNSPQACYRHALRDWRNCKPGGDFFWTYLSEMRKYLSWILNYLWMPCYNFFSFSFLRIR